MNEIKRQQLTWNKGMANVPDDLVCDDNMCECEVNMVYRLGEHRPVQNEEVLFGGEQLKPLLFVHKYGNYKHYVAVSGERIVWYDKDGSEGTAISNAPKLGSGVEAVAVGNTMVVNSSEGLGYYLWKQEEGNYRYLGAKIPEPQVRFGLMSDRKGQYMGDSVNLEGICDKKDGYMYVGDGKQDAYNDAVVGAYAKNKNKIAEEGGFCNPFFLRYAVEMFDGSYTCISVPILVMPSLSENSFWVTGGKASNDKYNLITVYTQLIYKIKNDYSDWKDLVRKIVVFASKGVDVYNTDKDQDVKHNTLSTEHKMQLIRCGYTDKDGVMQFYNSRVKNLVTEPKWNAEQKTITTDGGWFGPITITTDDNDFCTALTEKNDVMDEIQTDTVFYRLIELEAEQSAEWTVIKPKKGVLTNLTTQEKLDDDYFSNCVRSGKKIVAYNRRLNLISGSRSFWGGGDCMCLHDFDTFAYDPTFDIYVTIQTSSGLRVAHTERECSEYMLRHYFFYPDPRAKEVTIVLDRTKGYNSLWFKTGEKAYKGLSVKLSESPYLNGAVWFGTLPELDEPSADKWDWEELDAAPQEQVGQEYFMDKIWTSEANNPWVFMAEGDNTIGGGEILGVATQTTALSQGQFGQYPLLAFCTDGIWALQTGGDGLYTAVHPMSREVCNNADSITETDGQVFFTSEKGLMMVDGGTVRCVSEQMGGRRCEMVSTVYKGTLSEDVNLFMKEFLRGCFVAYDYRDSLLWIMQPRERYCYVYSIKDGTIAVKTLRGEMEHRVNDYPDTLMQDGNGVVYSLLERSDINEDREEYDCELVSRPMKLENSMARKSVMRLRMISEVSDGGSLGLRLLGSDDCRAWTEVTGLKGRSWKYWKAVVRLKGVRATDSLAGMLAETQDRYTGRMR